MFGRGVSDEFLNDASHGGTAGDASRSWLLLLLVLGGIGAFLAWAATFEIEEVTRGAGRVVPTRQTQIVQILEPGIVRSIEVRAGDTVEAVSPSASADAADDAAQDKPVAADGAAPGNALLQRAHLAFFAGGHGRRPQHGINIPPLEFRQSEVNTPAYGMFRVTA